MSPGGLLGRLGSLLGWAEDHPGRAILAIGVALGLAYAGAFVSGASRGDAIRGDAIQYYAYVRSIVFDGDLDFQNEYERFYGKGHPGDPPNRWLTERTPAGRPPNMMSVGPALLWSPAFVAQAGAAGALALAGLQQPPDGYSMASQLSAGLAGVAYATLGAWLSYRVARRLFPGRAAFWATIVAWLAGPAVYYTVISPTYSHATSLFAASLFVLVWLMGLGRHDGRRALALGLLGGLAALVRWQDAILVAMPAVELIASRLSGRTSTRQLLLFLPPVVVGVAIGVLPQLLAWQAVYGRPIVMPQGEGFMQWTEPAIVSVLFSTRHGLFLWTPALLIAAIGLYWVWRRDAAVGAAMGVTFALAVYVNAAAGDWWAGEAFGARRFISYTPLFAAGLAALGSRLDVAGRIRTLRIAALALTAYNLLFLLQYQLFMRGHTELAPYPESLKQILVDRLLVPFQLLARWLHG